jgi:uncharacterized protein YgbK (DUF1537 family)
MRTKAIHSVAIVADDLTSAADGAAPFVARGRAAVVGRGRPPHQAGAVVAVDCGSRSTSRLEAAARVADVTARLAGHDVLYKTVDSTLRGHITAELEACFKASGRKTLVFAPAFPAAGRTTVGGIQRVDGVPVSDSVYGRDPVHPARQSALAELVPACVENVVLLDAATQEELDSQIAALPDPESILWAGSPGMASALARRLVPGATPAASIRATDGDVLVVIGSANPRSHRQAERVDRTRGVTLLRVPGERQDDPTAVLQRLSAEASRVLLSGSFGTLIATGGDTMEAILDRLDVREFEVLQEFEPGFALGRSTLDTGRQLLLAMKAGGFGDDHALHRAIAKLRGATPIQAKASS